MNKSAYIESEVQGIFYSPFKAGDNVQEGERVGYTSDLFGAVLEEYKAPVSGIVLYKLGTQPINVGDDVMCISYVEDKS